MTFAIQIQYRVSLIIWLIGLIIQPVLYLVVWSTVTRTNGGAVGTFTRADFAAYFIALMVVNHLSFSWVMWGFDERVRLGTVSPFLLRPIHLIFIDIADNLTYKLLTLPVVLATAVVLTIAFKPSFQGGPVQIALFVPAILLACAMRFTVEWSTSLISFWTTRATALYQMYNVLVLFLSGQVAPLSLFPAPVQALATALPFRWMVAFPVELLLGRVHGRDVVIGVGMQLLWLILGTAAVQVLWRAGTRHYSAVGA